MWICNVASRSKHSITTQYMYNKEINEAWECVEVSIVKICYSNYYYIIKLNKCVSKK